MELFLWLPRGRASATCFGASGHVFFSSPRRVRSIRKQFPVCVKMPPNVHIILMRAVEAALRADGVVTLAAAALIHQNNAADIAPHFNKVLAIRCV